MNKQDYRNAMNKIKISDSFQARTAQLMQEVRDGKNSEPSEENTRIIPLENETGRFPSYIKYGALIAAVAVISFSAGVLLDPLSEDGITSAPSDAAASETLSETADMSAMDGDASEGGAEQAKKAEAGSGEDAQFEEDSVVDDDAAVLTEGEEPIVEIEPSMAPIPPETTAETFDEAPLAAEPQPDTTDAASEWEPMRNLVDSRESIGGFAENCFYFLSEERVKAPLNEANVEHTDVTELPRELISMTADILENTEPMENAVSPGEYARDPDLYMPLNWNGTTFVFGFHDDNSSFTFTVCGRSVTSLNSGLSYSLTEEEFLAYSDYSVQLVGGTLIPSANPAAEETPDMDD